MSERYPGFESSNPDYYEQYDNSIEKIHSQTVKIDKGLLQFWKWKYSLIKQEDVSLNNQLKLLLEQEWIIPYIRNWKQHIPNIKKLVFYNQKLYQWQVLYVPYVREWDKVYFLWVIHQNIVHKFSHPIEKEIWENKIYQEIWKLIWCNHCMLAERWNEIDFYEIRHHEKVKHFKLFGFIHGEMIYDKHTEKIFKWKILFNNFWQGIVLNSNWQIVYRIEDFWNVDAIVDRNWRLVCQLSKNNIVSFNIPETGEKVVLEISWN